MFLKRAHKEEDWHEQTPVVFVSSECGNREQSAITAPGPSPGHTPEARLGMGSAPVQDQTLSTMQDGKIPLGKPLGRVLRNNNLLLIPFYTRDIQNIQATYPSGH